jgi:outer membrane lipoprotein-sorting protein
MMARFSALRNWEEAFLRRRSIGVMLAITAAAGVSAGSQGRGTWTLEGLLRQLDIEARSFHSLTADVERTKVTVVVNDKSTESGQIFVHGDKMRLDLKQPDARTILRNGDDLYVYNPGLKRVEEYDLGKHRVEVDQFLLLGFGTPGKELEKGYSIALLDESTLDNKKVIWLELTPKSEQVRNQISKIQLWIDESSWLPAQQKFFEAGTQDYFVIRYSNIARNPKIHESLFKPHWPHGTQKIKPQG